MSSTYTDPEIARLWAEFATDIAEAADDAARWRVAQGAAVSLEAFGDRRLAAVLDRAADHAFDTIGGPLIIAMMRGDRAADAALWAVAAPAVHRLLQAAGG